MRRMSIDQEHAIFAFLNSFSLRMKSLSNPRKSDLIIGSSIVADSDIAFDKGLPPGYYCILPLKMIHALRRWPLIETHSISETQSR